MTPNSITIRIARPDDAAALLAIYAPYVTETAITFEYDVPSPSEFRRRIEETLASYPYLVAEEGGRILGYAYAGRFQRRAAYDWASELSVYVAQSARRLGIGRLLYAAMERALAAQHVANLYACIAAPAGKDPYLTDDSIRFHEAEGFTLAGRFRRCGYKFSRWYDMVWMEKEISRHTSPQPPFLPFPACREKIETLP